jgi:sulfate adenylyltransferase subunit 1
MQKHEKNYPMELLRFMTCGSVDDGKSTLIGRLLHDSKAIFEDQLASIAKSSQKRGLKETDLALLTDGLQAEREQGITIDVAYRYFSTPERRFIIADTPGHEQYTRNMVTGASTVDLAIILLDARRGVLPQTRRHTHLVHLLGIPRIVVAVNKMDAVEYSQERFNECVEAFQELQKNLSFEDVFFIPMSALQGDMVVDRGNYLSWYQGPTLMNVLETVPVNSDGAEAVFRFPVQLVQRGENGAVHEARLILGRVEAGVVSVGDEIVVWPAQVKSRIAGIQTLDGALDCAQAGQSVALTLADQVDLSRGDLITHVDSPPRCDKEFEAFVCWFSSEPLVPRQRLLIRQGTRTLAVKWAETKSHLDVNRSLEIQGRESVVMNDIVRASFRVQTNMAFDGYWHHRTTGCFILIDENTNNTVAAGMIQG